MLDIYIFENSGFGRAVKEICFRWLMEKNYDSDVICGDFGEAELPDSIGLYMMACGDKLRSVSDAVRKRNPENYIVVLLSGLSELAGAVRPSVCPSGYILKPPDASAVEELLGEIYSDYSKCFCSDNSRMFRFKLKSKEFSVPFSNIILFESRNKKILVRTEIQEFEYYDTMDNLLYAVPDEFIRIHKSYIVNTSRIASADFGAMTVVFDDGSEAYISRTYKNELKEKLRKDGKAF